MPAVLTHAPHFVRGDLAVNLPLVFGVPPDALNLYGRRLDRAVYSVHPTNVALIPKDWSVERPWCGG